MINIPSLTLQTDPRVRPDDAVGHENLNKKTGRFPTVQILKDPF